MQLLTLDGNGTDLLLPSDLSSAAPAASSSGSWLDGLTGWIDSAGKIFQAGTQVYVAADQRLKSIEALNDDTTGSQKSTSPIISGLPSNLPSWVVPVGIGVVVLVLILLVRKMR